MRLITAFATDDGEKSMNRHFGDADFYDIYEINENSAKFKKRISNTTEEDENVHADPKKAKGIAKILKEENVQVTVSNVYGPNIKRIKKKFVCIASNDEKISDAITQIQKNFNQVKSEFDKGNERNHLRL